MISRLSLARCRLAALTISQRAAIETTALQNELDGLTRCIQRSADGSGGGADVI